MADPICRWRNSSIKQLIEFNSIFPLLPTEKSQGRDYVEKNWKLFGGNNFFTTPYQLAAQMGVYYENESFMFPRFHKLITIDEASLYLQYWGKNYYAPNPYTKSIQQEKSVVINKFLVNWAKDKGITASFSEALKEMFSSEIGNTDILINMLNNFSEVQIKDDIVSLKDASTARYADSDVWLEVDQNDKEVFFKFVCKDKFVCHKISNTLQTPLQQIFYGAPGTGKSHKIKSEVDEKHKICYRTTFHPDSDYSTFVGAYKPSMKPTGTILASGEKEEIIKYTFVPQAFTKAYIHAWNTNDEVYLVIEEINRGNCAQIFGDLFQLLDRKDGFSEYPIDADSDLESHIKEKLDKSTRDDMPELVKAGKKLMLPSNLYIWATMNTSDQSLFPIDSAFKRRWDWVYTPIKQHDEEYKIVVGEDTEYDWWGFLEKINQVIDDATSSEDKKLGYFFVKAQDKKISTEKFVGKVLFYLWNDVFKNYGFDSPIFSKGGNKKFAFSDFFTKSGEPELEVVKAFLDKLDETIDKDNSFKIKNKKSDSSAEAGEQA